jgi:hypothetical protein
MSEDNEDGFDGFDGLELEERDRVLLGDKAVVKMLVADSDSANFVCTDINGAQHDLSPPGSCYYITSRPEGSLHRINAGYWPDELAEESVEECRQRRGYDPIEFLVDDVEHTRMLRAGILDAVEGQNVLEALCARADARSGGRREN